MLPPHLLERASLCLRGRFGDQFVAPYWPAKVEMADFLMAALHVPQKQIFQTVDELERRGAVRFQRPAPEATQHPAADQPTGYPADRARPHLTQADPRATALDKGTWTIDPQRVRCAG